MKRRFLAVVGIAAAVLAVVIVLVLGAEGVLPIFGSSASVGQPASTYEGWRAAAQLVADGYQGGGWHIVAAWALLNATGQTILIGGVISYYSHPQCRASAAAGVPTNVSVSGLANISDGRSHDWFYAFENASGTGLLLIGVVNGSAIPLATLTGGGCSTWLASYSSVDSTVIDSSVAAHALGSAGAYEFLANHSATVADMYLSGSYTLNGTAVGATWDIGYQDCAPVAGNSSRPVDGPVFFGLVDAHSGSVRAVDGGELPC